MKKLLFLCAFSVLVLACKTEEKKEIQKEISKVDYPVGLGEVFKKHGGLEAWKKANTLSYKIHEEEHTIDLHSRRTLVTGSNYTLGFDGKEVWLAQQDTTAFKKDPKFYYNLFFYFYAMPFVLADDGIIYEEVASFVHEGVTYPGLKIGYEPKVGMSPEDNYFIYYHPETYQMEWLGYTVTYFSKKSSAKVKMIRYNDWHDVNGFLLPKSITWYKKDENDGVLKASEKKVEFLAPLVSKATMAKNFFKNKK